MIVAPSLWLTVVGGIAMLAAFTIALRWATQPDPSITDRWREIDERIKANG